MAVKNYGIHDKWTDLDKLNNVDIKSVDGVIESVKINGEEAGGGGGSSDLTWILPEQTVTLVDLPVEVTGLRLDLIPNSVVYVALKSTSAGLHGNITVYYSLQYFEGELATDSGEVFISNIDGKYMFGVSDGESIVPNTYTISIALF